MNKKKTCDSCGSDNDQGGGRTWGVCGHCANSYGHQHLTDIEWAEFEGEIPTSVDDAQAEHYPEPF